MRHVSTEELSVNVRTEPHKQEDLTGASIYRGRQVAWKSQCFGTHNCREYVAKSVIGHSDSIPEPRAGKHGIEFPRVAQEVLAPEILELLD